MAEWYELPGSLKGPKGDAGDAGTDGTDGTDGADGAPGTPVTNVANDAEAGTITVYVGEVAYGPFFVRGPAGADGSGIELQGAVATYADLPATPSDGDAYVVQADGRLYVANADGDFPADGDGVQFKGDKGDQGLRGEQGARGTKWSVGTTPPSSGVAIGDLNLNPSDGTIQVYAETAP